MINNQKNIKNIIFDLGGVILDIDMNKSVDAFNLLGISGFKSEDIHPNTKDFFIDLEKGTISTHQFFESILAAYPTQKTISQKDLYEAWAALLLPFKKERIKILQELKNKNYKIYLLSNTNYPHRIRFLNNFARQFGFDMESLFEKCYYSDDLGMRKPDKSIYAHVIQDSYLDPKETIFIDDNACNLDGAKECGLHTYHLKATDGETIEDFFKK